MKEPEVSVITINYNNCKGLAKTLESVFSQTYMEFEYVIIDGASEDKSMELVSKYEEKFREKGIQYTYISEKDSGIYDAMNKGIKLASGKWLHFLNSGDCYCSQTVLESVFKNNNFYGLDIVYGKWKKDGTKGLVDGNVYYLDNLKNIKKEDYPFFLTFPKKGVLPTAHLAMFFRTEKMKKRGYCLGYSICADFEWFMYAYCNEKKFGFVNEYICIFDLNGVSSQKLVDKYKQTVAIRHMYGTQDNLILEKIKLFVWYLIEKVRN